MEKRKKVLYVASTQNEAKTCFDGETLKSEAVKEILEKHFDVTLINLTKHKLFRTIKLLFMACFKRFDRYVVSKSSLGANKILSIFRFFHVKRKIVFLAIGSGLPNFIEDKKVNIKNFKYASNVVVETDYLKEELVNLGLSNVDVMPNFKRIYDFKKIKKEYPKKVLKLYFFSRVVYDKGIVDLMKILKDINIDKTLYSLDIYGKYYDDKCINEIRSLEDDNMKYLGMISLNSKEDYDKLKDYDLHAFPTKHDGEGVPGSIIDSLILDIPTISSKYVNYKSILDDKIAFLYDYKSNDKLKELLIYIYEHQEEINEKRTAITKIVSNFSEEHFEESLLKVLESKENIAQIS